MISFHIQEIDNGYLVKGSFDFLEDSKGNFVEDFTIYSATLPDAFATIATKCDNLMDDVIEKAEQGRDEITEELPF